MNNSSTENFILDDYLPHKEPMLMVNKIKYITPEAVETNFLIKENNVFIDDGFLDESGLIENAAQTCSTIVGRTFYNTNEDKEKKVIGYISSIKTLKIYHLPKVNETINTKAKLLSKFDSEGYSTCSLLCEISSENILLFEGELNLFIKKID